MATADACEVAVAVMNTGVAISDKVDVGDGDEVGVGDGDAVAEAETVAVAVVISSHTLAGSVHVQ